MKTPHFEYRAPRTIDEALALLAEHADEAKVLAGGQSLVPLLAMRLARPSYVIDINDVAGLTGITALDGASKGVAFGALTRERDAERSTLVTERLPVLAEALPLIGHVSIRNRGTIGGSIAHADASAELPTVAVALGAQMVVRSTKGERVVAASDFFQGHFTTSMADNELLTEVRMPAGPAGAGWSFQEIVRRHGDFGLVGVATMVAMNGNVISEARIALMGVAERAVRVTATERALVGQSANADVFSAAAAEATKSLSPASDVHGSADFRRHLAGVVVRRALIEAAGRAGGAK